MYFVLAAALLVSGARLAHAQTVAPPLPPVSETTIVTATVAPVPADTIARTVTVLTREDLERLGLRSIAEALRLAPGLDARARGPRDVQTDFSIRGATFGQSLILIDGIRLNDSQSGHHNGEIPTAMAGLDRLEIVPGGGSAVHGADALGGVIHFLTRTDRHATASLAAGQFGTVDLQASVSGAPLPARWTLTGWASRSGGFMFDRDYALGGAAARGPAGRSWTLDLRHQRRAFGANGFYGPSPSKEWTDQTIVAAGWQRARREWHALIRLSARDHGDHFRWDINRPGFAENRHRTQAALVEAQVGRQMAGGARLTVGAAAGYDRIRSSNLGNHAFTSGGAFGEVQRPIGARSIVLAGLRWDGYTTFGQAWSPSVAAGTWIGDLHLRVSAARAFRIPTFTERFYHDPFNAGSPDLVAERGWSLDAGADWRRGGWTISVSPFARWDASVIDWVKPQPADIWRSTNVRDVTTTGAELSATRRWTEALLRVHYTALYVDAPRLDLLSKYVLEYARDSAGLSLAVPIGGRLRVSMNADYRHRLDGQIYTLLAARLSRRVGRADLSVEGSNLLDERYREIAGVDLPGRWVMVGIAVR
jgi:outer membrane cobalamin receptor